MTAETERRLWIVVGGELEAHGSLEEAVGRFDSLAALVAEDGKIVCLTYNPEGKAQPGKGETPMWGIEDVPLKAIAEKMLERG